MNNKRFFQIVAVVVIVAGLILAGVKVITSGSGTQVVQASPAEKAPAYLDAGFQPVIERAAELGSGRTTIGWKDAGASSPFAAANSAAVHVDGYLDAGASAPFAALNSATVHVDGYLDAGASRLFATGPAPRLEHVDGYLDAGASAPFAPGHIDGWMDAGASAPLR